MATSTFSRPTLPWEILDRIAVESVDSISLPFESWLVNRHVCRSFKEEIEKAFVKRWLAQLCLVCDLGFRILDDDDEERVISKEFSFKGLDRAKPTMAIFEDDMGLPCLHDDGLICPSERKRRVRQSHNLKA